MPSSASPTSSFVYAEGVALGADAERAAIADAERQIEAALA